MTIGAKIAACRKRAGMSQEKLANELNISRQAVSRWETGEAVPDTEKVIQLSRIFHVTTDYLLLDIDEAPQSAAPAENNRETEQRAAEKRMKRQSMRMHFGWFLLIFGIIALSATLSGAGLYAQTLTEGGQTSAATAPRCSIPGSWHRSSSMPLSPSAASSSSSANTSLSAKSNS